MEFSTLRTIEVVFMKKSQTKDKIGIPEQRGMNRNGKVYKKEVEINSQKCKKMDYSRKFC